MAFLLELISCAEMRIKMIKQLKRGLHVIWPLLALGLVGLVLLWERTGVKMDIEMQTSGNASQVRTAEVIQNTDTLVLAARGDENADVFLSEMALILENMKVAFDIKYVEDLVKSDFGIEEMERYDKLVICFTNLDLLEEKISVLTSWVKAGGCMMNMATYDTTANFHVLSGKMGIVEGGDSYMESGGFYVDENFMIGAKDREFRFEEAYKASLKVLLSKECSVYMNSLDYDLPLLWECDYGDGKFVVMNQTLTGKAARGILAAAYSLMDEISVYPVINASAFYLDDFPAPVPAGNGQYIKEEYGMDISNFYANIWWKDVLEWEEKYGIIHTGLIIEDYSDIVNEPFVRTESIERFHFFGNMLLNHNGELGFHGYNHMPLCFQDFDYKGLYDGYTLWETQEEMKMALTELSDFSTELFPENEFQVYVPPSNILSREGRQVLVETLPAIRAIASTYLPGDCVYEQEFGIGEDGVIETPRITSGAIMDDYTYLIAFSELNFHYVQSHFMHPDDVLDEDRGAALGWGTLHDNLEEYLSYIYTAAPNIEDVTGSGMADKVEDYTLLTINRQESEQGISFDIGGFLEEATFMVRLNASCGKQLTVTGAEYEKLTENLYVLRANQPHVVISWK